MHSVGIVDSGATLLSRSTAGAALPSRPGSDDILERLLLFFFVFSHAFRLRGLPHVLLAVDDT